VAVAPPVNAAAPIFPATSAVFSIGIIFPHPSGSLILFFCTYGILVIFRIYNYGKKIYYPSVVTVVGEHIVLDV
jgi:hypothetical protein